MMKLAVTALTLILASSLSQAKMTSVERVLASQKRLELKTQMQMKSVLVHVMPKAQRRLLVTNDLNDDEPPGPDELDLQSPYRRPRVSTPTPDDSVSDYVAVRLAVARARAMNAYRKIWT